MPEGTNPTVTEQAKLMRDLLEASILFMARETTPGVPPSGVGDLMASAYAGAAARLLHEVMRWQESSFVARELSDWLEFGEPLADWVGEKAAECGIDVDALIEQRLRPNPTVTEPVGSSVILGRALLVRKGVYDSVFLHDEGRDYWTRVPGSRFTRAEITSSYPDAREVLLVDLAAGRVLEAAQAVAACQSRGHPKWGAVLTELAAAVDAMVAQSPSSLPPVAQPPAEPGLCRAEYARTGGRQPGDRIVECGQPAGHGGEWHEEDGTGFTWPTARAQPAPDLTSLVGAAPDLTGGVEPGAYVRAQWCPHHDDPATCAAAQEAGPLGPPPAKVLCGCGVRIIHATADGYGRDGCDDPIPDGGPVAADLTEPSDHIHICLLTKEHHEHECHCGWSWQAYRWYEDGEVHHARYEQCASTLSVLGRPLRCVLRARHREQHRNEQATTWEERAYRQPVPVPDSDGKGWSRDLVDAFSESSGEVATLERELAEVTEDRDRLRQDLNDAPDVTWIARCDEAEAEVDRLRGELERLRGDGVDPGAIVEQRAKGWPDFHPEQYCHRCGRPNIWSWFTENELWNAAEGNGDGILCPVCFVAGYERATDQQERITWRVVPEKAGDEASFARDELHKANERLAQLHTWQGLMSLLDEQYPPDVRLGPDSDPGPRILGLTRALDAARSELETARRDGAADALEEAANDANRLLGEAGPRAFTAADLRQRAAEVRSGQRRIDPAGVGEEAAGGEPVADYCLCCNRPMVRRDGKLVHRDGDPKRCSPPVASEVANDA